MTAGSGNACECGVEEGIYAGVARCRRAWVFLFLSMPSAAVASDFTPLMVLLLVPFSVLALVVWAITWLPTQGMKPVWLKIVIRSFGVCLVFTPTHTPGGNGRMLSVSLYDLVSSALGMDPVYAQQAIMNVAVATVAVSGLALLIVYLDRWKPARRNGPGERSVEGSEDEGT